MAGHLIVVSEEAEDLEFFRKVAVQNRFSFDESKNTDHLRRVVSSRKDCVVVINADAHGRIDETLTLASKYVPGRQIVTISGKADSFYGTLLSKGFPGHHLLRRYQDPSLELYIRLVQSALEKGDWSLTHLFSDKTKIQKLRIKRVSHKAAAVEGVQNVLNKLGIRDRLAALVAQAADELILNAIFDAPVLGENRTLYYRPRHLEVELDDHEIIEIQLAANTSYMSVSVTDHFGSLSLRSATAAMVQKPREREKSTGTGLNGIYNSGLSLIMVSRPKVSTEMVLVFPRADSFKDFRNGFRFTSLLNGSIGIRTPK